METVNVIKNPVCALHTFVAVKDNVIRNRAIPSICQIRKTVCACTVDYTQCLQVIVIKK